MKTLACIGEHFFLHCSILHCAPPSFSLFNSRTRPITMLLSHLHALLAVGATLSRGHALVPETERQACTKIWPLYDRACCKEGDIYNNCEAGITDQNPIR
jgi:hypothetical protein